MNSIILAIFLNQRKTKLHIKTLSDWDFIYLISVLQENATNANKNKKNINYSFFTKFILIHPRSRNSCFSCSQQNIYIAMAEKTSYLCV